MRFFLDFYVTKIQKIKREDNIIMEAKNNNPDPGNQIETPTSDTKSEVQTVNDEPTEIPEQDNTQIQEDNPDNVEPTQTPEDNQPAELEKPPEEPEPPQTQELNSSQESSTETTIIDSTENGFRIFKKMQKNADEILFYNSDYFNRIGFPNTEVIIGKVEPDGIMKGGYYAHPEKLTYPFRHFVYLIQREPRNEQERRELQYETETEPSTEKLGFFERLGNYGIYMSKGVQSGIDSISPYFKKSPENMTEEEKLQAKKEEDEQLEEDKKKKEQDEYNAKTEEEKRQDDYDKRNYWIVKIPIVDDEEDDILPPGPLEIEEKKHRQKLLEARMEKSNLKSKVGPMYSVGKRYIGMCESVKDWVAPEYESSKVKGSLMSKYANKGPEKR